MTPAQTTTNSIHQATKIGDPVAIAAAFLSFFKLIPWPEVAAFLAAVYTFLRICEWVWEKSFVKKRKARNLKRRVTD